MPKNDAKIDVEHAAITHNTALTGNMDQANSRSPTLTPLSSIKLPLILFEDLSIVFDFFVL